MKRILSVVVFVGMCSLAWAGMTNDLQAARALAAAGKTAEALAAFDAALKGNETASEDLKAQASVGIGNMLRDQRKYAEAQAAFGMAGSNKAAGSETRAYAVYMAGLCLRSQGKLADAIAVFLAGAEEFPVASLPVLAGYQWGLGACYSAQGDTARANDAWVAYTLLVARYPDVTSAKLSVGFDRLVPSAMTAEAYKAALGEILRATPATAACVGFLGRVKSELSKME